MSWCSSPLHLLCAAKRDLCAAQAPKASWGTLLTLYATDCLPAGTIDRHPAAHSLNMTDTHRFRTWLRQGPSRSVRNITRVPGTHTATTSNDSVLHIEIRPDGATISRPRGFDSTPMPFDFPAPASELRRWEVVVGAVADVETRDAAGRGAVYVPREATRITVRYSICLVCRGPLLRGWCWRRAVAGGHFFAYSTKSRRYKPGTRELVMRALDAIAKRVGL